MNLIWKPINEYEGLYEVSNTGLVRSLDRTVSMSTRWGKPTTRTIKGKILSPNMGTWSPQVALGKNGKNINFFVNRLVAISFIPNPDNLPLVMHKDDNTLNNHVDNLQWGTHADNMNDRDTKERQARGEKQAHAKLTESSVMEIKRLLLEGAADKQLSEQFSVSPACIWQIRRGNSWKHVEVS
nr:NUMOD4 domain-containing protein [Burkholderia aenigmatica]